jgi:hypothetical protein
MEDMRTQTSREEGEWAAIPNFLRQALESRRFRFKKELVVLQRDATKAEESGTPGGEVAKLKEKVTAHSTKQRQSVIFFHKGSLREVRTSLTPAEQKNANIVPFTFDSIVPSISVGIKGRPFLVRWRKYQIPKVTDAPVFEEKQTVAMNLGSLAFLADAYQDCSDGEEENVEHGDEVQLEEGMGDFDGEVEVEEEEGEETTIHPAFAAVAAALGLPTMRTNSYEKFSTPTYDKSRVPPPPTHSHTCCAVLCCAVAVLLLLRMLMTLLLLMTLLMFLWLAAAAAE